MLLFYDPNISVICLSYLTQTDKGKFIYRMTTFVIYLLSFLSMIAFTATLNLGQLWLVFLISGLLGYVRCDHFEQVIFA